MRPSQTLLLEADRPDAVRPDGRVGKIAEDFAADGVRLRRRGDNSRATVADGALEAAHVGDDHRHFEVVRDGGNAALGGAPVGEDGHVGRGEEGLDLGIPDVVREHVHPVFPGKGVDDRPVLVEGTVRLAGDHELVVFRQVPEGLQEDVQPLVVPDQAEEQERLPRRVDAERLRGRLPRELFPEVGIERVGEQDVPGVGLQGEEVVRHAL